MYIVVYMVGNYVSHVLFYRGNEKCKDTSRENDKHSVNLAASSIAPTTFNLAIDTLEVTFYFYFSEE